MRNFDQAYDRCGSKRVGSNAARGRGMSASPPEATKLMQRRELSRCAITGREQMQQIEPLFDHLVS
jgi:hypothetical protein